MIDLHCHILPAVDDGAPDLETALRMGKAMVADGVTIAGCTPHILPGLYQNTGPQIRQGVVELSIQLKRAGIPLELVPGADNHIIPNFLAGLKSGHLLTLADSRYVLVEPPHHVAPPRLDEMMFNLVVAGYVPILTHPERLAWISTHYDLIRQLSLSGVWMQLTAGSLAGDFGRGAQFWSQRMLEDSIVHILASDAHDLRRRAPQLARGRELAARMLGDAEAEDLVLTRPLGIIMDERPENLPRPGSRAGGIRTRDGNARSASGGHRSGGLLGRLREFFG